MYKLTGGYRRAPWREWILARSTLGLMCCKCGDPIIGMVPKWKKGAPICFSCLFRVSAFRSIRVKERKILTVKTQLPMSWRIGLLLVLFAGVYLMVF